MTRCRRLVVAAAAERVRARARLPTDRRRTIGSPIPERRGAASGSRHAAGLIEVALAPSAKRAHRIPSTTMPTVGPTATAMIS